MDHERLAHLVGEREASDNFRRAHRGPGAVRDVDDVEPRIPAEAPAVVVATCHIAGGPAVHVDPAPVRRVAGASGAAGVHARQVPYQDLGNHARAGYVDPACDTQAARVARVARERDHAHHLAGHKHATRDPAACKLVDDERPTRKFPERQSGVHRRVRGGHPRAVGNVRDATPRVGAENAAVVVASNHRGVVTSRAKVHVNSTAVGHTVSCARHATLVQTCKVPLESLCRISRDGHYSSHSEASGVRGVKADSTAD
jgi:hypothetical protein